MKISENQYKKYFGFSNAVKGNKYHNKKTTLFDMKFDSIKERNRYILLDELKKKKIITELKLQQKFIIQESFVDNTGKTQRPIYYIADFYYYDTRMKCYVAEDVKSKATREDKVYRIKKKMFLHEYPNIIFKEIV
jgi:hypothetical protein